MMPFFASCSKSEEPTECFISLDYTLAESGNMSRSGETLYSDFYNKYVVPRILTPTQYELTFTNIADNSQISISDSWDKGHALKLLSGTYRVAGYSIPCGSEINGALDTLSLSFDEEIVVNADTKKVNLAAKHDSFMIFFDASDMKKIQYCKDGHYAHNSYLKSVNNIFYMFLRTTSTADYLNITRTNGGTASVQIGKMGLEKGKYYYFGDAETEYELPGMDAGN